MFVSFGLFISRCAVPRRSRDTVQRSYVPQLKLLLWKMIGQRYLQNQLGLQQEYSNLDGVKLVADITAAFVVVAVVSRKQPAPKASRPLRKWNTSETYPPQHIHDGGDQVKMLARNLTIAPLIRIGPGLKDRFLLPLETRGVWHTP